VSPGLSPGRWFWGLHGRSYVLEWHVPYGASVHRVGTKATGYRWRICVLGNEHVGGMWTEPGPAILAAERALDEAVARLITVTAAPTRETKGGTDA
jgi:hypothetical protein